MCLAWDFLLSKDRIWVAWFRNCYLKKASYWNVVVKGSSSAVWRSIVAVRDFIKSNYRFQIGNGQKTKVFLDPWCEGKFLSEIFNRRTLGCLSRDKNICMSAIITDGQWDEGILGNTTQDLMQAFKNLLMIAGEDQLQWHTPPFGFQKAWEAARVKNQEVTWATLCWNGGRPRWSVHAVLIMHRAVISHDFLQKRGFALASRCYLCYNEVENVDHLVCGCEYVWKVWSFLSHVCSWNLHRVFALADLLLQFDQSQRKDVKKIIPSLFYSYTIFYMVGEE
ncbi:uncharacterized protein LOC132266314 [Cornus florida]|uniref:uncharacterized protein LOC132266314 n=1 Tax=Cornus florida TaxID=4283 RepID=UPI00289B4DAE|nr:uncharacterized protein LOC132266314 [Cornus florida]